MKTSLKAAVSGVMSALSVALLALASVMWILDYTSPIICGLLLIIIVESFGKKTAFTVFAAVCVLSIILLPSKGAALFYTTFCGYYPIIRKDIDKIKSRIIRIIIKFVIFNIGAVGSELLLVYVFGIPFDNALGAAGIVILLVAAYVILFTYDRLLNVLTLIYDKKYKKRLEKYLK